MSRAHARARDSRDFDGVRGTPLPGPDDAAVAPLSSPPPRLATGPHLRQAGAAVALPRRRPGW